jgi:hypothetical protein
VFLGPPKMILLLDEICGFGKNIDLLDRKVDRLGGKDSERRNP